MKTFVLCFILFPFTLFSQQLPKDSKNWLEQGLKDSTFITKEFKGDIISDEKLFPIGITVSSEELKPEFINNNFSSVWLARQDAILGFIGDNYQRFYVHFQTIKKNDTIPSSYLVKGKSRVRNNVCDFEGEIRILHIRVINKKQREDWLKMAIQDKDSDFIERNKYEKYMVLAEYNFREDKSQKESGLFKGIMASFFYIKDNSITFDDLDFEFSDNYSNNLCVGVWKSYKTGIEKKCNWGNCRIPHCGDLGGGASEFIPNHKYLKSGWENFQRAVEGNPEALKEEEKKWW